MSIVLNLPPYPYRLQEQKGRPYIYDDLRRKWVLHTPEEWVRQHLLHYLVNKKQYLPGLIAIERKIKNPAQVNRFDILCYNRYGQPYLLIECKKPEQEINHDTFMQTAHYNKSLRSQYIAVSNGLTHFAAKADYAANEFKFLEEFPDYV